ncbi:MAG: MFS transporter [Jatrophihabitans sp.]
MHVGKLRLGRSYTALWAASTISNLGDGIRAAALPLLAASASASPGAVAAIAFSGQVPWLVVSLATGALADRWNRRSIMWIVDTVRAVIMSSLAIWAWTGHVGVGLLCIVAFLLGSAQTAFDNASHAVLPAMVPKEGLPAANGRLMSSRIVFANLAGSPLGGILFAVAVALPFCLDGVSFLAAALIVAVGLPRQVGRVAERSDSGILTSIRTGFTWVRHNRAVMDIAVVIAVVNFTQATTQSILVLYALDDLGLGRAGYGFLLAAAGIGGAVGGLLIGPASRRIDGRVILSSAIIATVPIFALLAVTSSPWVAALLLASNATCGVGASVLLSSTRQALVPPHLLARVNSIVGMTAIGIGLPLGSLVGGGIASWLGLRAPFVLSAILVAACCLFLPRIMVSYGLKPAERDIAGG